MYTLALLTRQLARALLALMTLGAMFWLLYSYPVFLIAGVLLLLWMLSRVERLGTVSIRLIPLSGRVRPTAGRLGRRNSPTAE